LLQTFEVYEDKNYLASMVVVNSTKKGREKQHYVRQFYIFVLYKLI